MSRRDATRTPDLSDHAFEAEVREFLRDHASPRRSVRTHWGSGSDAVGLFDDEQTETELLARAREFRRVLFDAGLGWITGPREYGGRALPRSFQRTLARLVDEFETPDEMRLSVGLGMVGPTIATHGSAAVKERYLKAIYRADLVACQLFSEPEAGSDLAAVRTTAEWVDDHWTITGQKVWTSGAHFSDIGMLLARTGARDSRHRGLTMFLLDMGAPGVEVRPLRQMTGDASFDEVFLDGVKIPDDHRLGEVDDGWTVAMTTLVNERGSIGGGGRGVGGGDHLLDRLRSVVEHDVRSDDHVVRQALADLYTRVSVAQMFQAQMMARMADDRDPGPIVAISKLMLTDNLQRTSQLAGLVLGPRAVVDSGDWGTYAWSELILGVPGLRVGGGTDEIQKNMLAERVLGLPREPRTELR